jgi:hypothetical protein
LTPKEGNAFLHGDMFTIQLLGILTNTIQLSIGGKESNILLFDSTNGQFSNGMHQI